MLCYPFDAHVAVSLHIMQGFFIFVFHVLRNDKVKKIHNLSLLPAVLLDCKCLWETIAQTI